MKLLKGLPTLINSKNKMPNQNKNKNKKKKNNFSKTSQMIKALLMKIWLK
jgi:hypothetical protein